MIQLYEMLITVLVSTLQKGDDYIAEGAEEIHQNVV